MDNPINRAFKNMKRCQDLIFPNIWKTPCFSFPFHFPVDRPINRAFKDTKKVSGSNISEYLKNCVFFFPTHCRYLPKNETSITTGSGKIRFFLWESPHKFTHTVFLCYFCDPTPSPLPKGLNKYKRCTENGFSLCHATSKRRGRIFTCFAEKNWI